LFSSDKWIFSSPGEKMKFTADFHVHSKYSRVTSITKINMAVKIILILIILMLAISEPISAWMAEWATYKRPALAPNETKVVFECCRNVEEPECEDSLKENDIFLVDMNTKELKPLTFDIENDWLAPDKSKILIQTHYGLYLVDLPNIALPKEIFNRFPSGGFDDRSNPIIMVSWSPDGKKFLFIRALGFDGKRVSSIFDSETYEETVLDVDLFPCAVIWHPNGNSIFYDQEGDVNWLDLTTGRTGLILSGYPDPSCHDPIISPDGKKVLYQASHFFKIRTIGLRDRKIFAQWLEFPQWAARELKESIWHSHKELVREMQYLLLDGPISNLRFIWSQNGERILINDKDEIWLYVLSDSSFVPVHCDSLTISEMVWSPNQQEIFFVSQYQKDTNQDGVINIFDKTFGYLNVVNLRDNSFKTILSELESLRNLSFSSDGSLLAYETGGNIRILNTTTFKSYPLTTSGGTKANWLANDKMLLFEDKKSLYTVDKNGQNLTRLTVAKGKEAMWLSDREVAVKSGDKYCKMAIDKLEVKEQTTALKTLPRLKGKKYEVYVTDSKFDMQPYNVSEIWVKEIKTDKSWKIKEAWKNY
jgi:Tol biopolymer transport system component